MGEKDEGIKRCKMVVTEYHGDVKYSILSAQSHMWLVAGVLDNTVTEPVHPCRVFFLLERTGLEKGPF